ncbi:MAG: hypothetical protein ABI321_22995 [Polyangia bacterium]
MDAALTWSTEGDAVQIVGRIDENADLGLLAASLPVGPLTFDLGGLTRINSIGVREWMDFVTSLGAREVRLVRCAPVFVEQLNAIANFAGAAVIETLLAAFECEHDSHVLTREVKSDDARKGVFPSVPKCPECGREMLPAFEDDLYYRFLRYTK